MGLTKQLEQVVSDYFLKYPNVSINGLAMKSGVGATTLRRIVNESIKTEPAPHTILNLTSAISNEKNLSSIIKKYDGPIGNLLKKTFGPYLKAKLPHVISADLNEELKDWIKYAIYKLAANRKGVSKIKVAELFGKLGLERFEDLAQKSLLEVVEGVAHAAQKNFSLDITIAADHLPEMVKFYKPKEVAQGKNIFYTLSETLSEEGIQKIKEIQREAVNKIFEVMNSQEFEGEIPYITLNLADTIELNNNRGLLQ